MNDLIIAKMKNIEYGYLKTAPKKGLSYLDPLVSSATSYQNS